MILLVTGELQGTGKVLGASVMTESLGADSVNATVKAGLARKMKDIKNPAKELLKVCHMKVVLLLLAFSRDTLTSISALIIGAT